MFIKVVIEMTPNAFKHLMGSITLVILQNPVNPQSETLMSLLVDEITHYMANFTISSKYKIYRITTTNKLGGQRKPCRNHNTMYAFLCTLHGFGMAVEYISGSGRGVASANPTITTIGMRKASL